MGDQTKYMEISIKRDNETSNNIKKILIIITSREFGGKLPNNGLFNLSLS